VRACVQLHKVESTKPVRCINSAAGSAVARARVRACACACVRASICQNMCVKQLSGKAQAKLRADSNSVCYDHFCEDAIIDTEEALQLDQVAGTWKQPQ
jgi:hypothetical protein